ncbi:hypothetical protein Tco_1066094 [Tanacetum coccineum]
MDLRPVHPGLLFTAGLANVWEYPDCRVVFKDIVGDVVRKEQPTSSRGATSPTPINTVALVSNSEQKGDSSTEVKEVHGLFRRPSQNSTPELVQE